jgi:hypothetical protein
MAQLQSTSVTGTLTTTGNVGVGTSTFTSLGGFNRVLYIRGGYASMVMTSTIPNKSWEIGVNASSLLTFYDGTADRMVIDTNGNVGIGTIIPASLLHVYGSGNTFTRYTNTTSAGHYIDIGANSAGESFVYGYGAYPLLFGTNGNTRMTITSGGNVGIGTDTPAGKFEIKSAAQQYITAPAITFTDNTGVADSRWILGNIATT